MPVFRRGVTRPDGPVDAHSSSRWGASKGEGYQPDEARGDRSGDTGYQLQPLHALGGNVGPAAIVQAGFSDPAWPVATQETDQNSPFLGERLSGHQNWLPVRQPTGSSASGWPRRERDHPLAINVRSVDGSCFCFEAEGANFVKDRERSLGMAANRLLGVDADLA